MKKITLRDDFMPLDQISKEAMNELAGNVTFSGKPNRAIMLTSCVGAQGTSFVTLHLAQALSKLGHSCVVVDANFRKSAYSRKENPGVSVQHVGVVQCLQGEETLENVQYMLEGSAVHLLAAGKTVLDPLPLLSSATFSKLLHTLKETYDYVLVDAPPVGVAIDAAIIATACDAVLFVTTLAQNRKGFVEAIRQINQTNTPIIGVALNKAPMQKQPFQKYYYGTRYEKYGMQYGDT